MKTTLVPRGHSKPVGKYSPGLSVDGGRFVFVSGQVATDEQGNVVAPGDAAKQTEIVFERIEQVLAQAQATLADLVSVVIYVVDVKRDFAAVSGVRNRVLSNPPPTSALVEVSSLVEDGCLVEISGIAVVAGT
ncbi:RidA family protein [Lentzea sp. NPDC004782]|uniref:RidA family protein n=1 Tax=Lentzea sp. NPDC004782 TaxID=3154458 RepID=UPI0033A8C9A6